MDQKQAAVALKQAQRLQASTRAMLHSFWFPMVFWGGVTLLSSLPVAIAGIEALAFFWPIAGISGFVVMATYFSNREKTIGVKGRAWPYIVLSISLMIGAGLAANFGSSYSREIGPWLVISFAYLGFARLATSWFLACLAFALGLLAALVGLGDGNSYMPLAMSYGLSFIIAGLVARNAERSHA